MKEVVLGFDGMTLGDLVSIAREHARVRVSDDSIHRIKESRRLIERWVEEGRVIYGITTGFGALSDVVISKEDTKQLQKNVLMSHSAGVGQPMDEETVRATMALRIKDFARGNSGIRPETVQHLVSLLNSNICPVIPEKGSVGASGDLAPLAHLSLVLIGLGEAFVDGQRIPGEEALKKAGLAPLTLGPGEGLALVNGTQVMTAIAGLATYDAERLAKTTDIAAALSLEVLMGSRTEFDPLIHNVRPHPGQAASADNMQRITKNSEIISSHKDCKRIQDAYTLRNSSTNNPLVFSDMEKFLLGGNFHGQPIALTMDSMCMAVAELANISERRIERLVNPHLSGLPAFLVDDGGLNSGFMIAQYTAASLVSENKVLCHPACVDSIPTSANKEDHVSFGTTSARKCRDVVKNAEQVIAIELLCAAQAMDLFTNMKPGEGTLAAYRFIREEVPRLERDRILSTDIQKMVQIIKSGRLLERVESVVGKLN
ncbi:MAG: histidine ammonia-lyase [Deltaproteobacteria bacterium]|nr:histidine ammonia-lyase [Deltaproteobacteria bacterium]